MFEHYIYWQILVNVFQWYHRTFQSHTTCLAWSIELQEMMLDISFRINYLSSMTLFILIKFRSRRIHHFIGGSLERPVWLRTIFGSLLGSGSNSVSCSHTRVIFKRNEWLVVSAEKFKVEYFLKKIFNSLFQWTMIPSKFWRYVNSHILEFRNCSLYCIIHKYIDIEIEYCT